MEDRGKVALLAVMVAIPTLAVTLQVFGSPSPRDSELEEVAAEAVRLFLGENSATVDDDIAAARRLFTGEAARSYEMSLEAVEIRHRKRYADFVRERRIETVFADVSADRENFEGAEAGTDGPYYVAVAGLRTIRSSDGGDLASDAFLYLVRIVRSEEGGGARLVVDGLADYQGNAKP